MSPGRYTSGLSVGKSDGEKTSSRQIRKRSCPGDSVKLPGSTEAFIVVYFIVKIIQEFYLQIISLKYTYVLFRNELKNVPAHSAEKCFSLHIN